MNILNLFSSVSKMLPLVIDEPMDNLNWVNVEDLVEIMKDTDEQEEEKTISRTRTRLYTRRTQNIVHKLDDFNMLNERELFDHVESRNTENQSTLETENIVPEDESIVNDPTYEELEDTNTYTDI